MSNERCRKHLLSYCEECHAPSAAAPLSPADEKAAIAMHQRLKPSADAAAGEEYRVVCCADCGLAYGSEGWIECMLPAEQWAAISPTGDEGGILCITCIARRLKRRGGAPVPVMLCGTEALRVADQDEAFDRGWRCAEKRIRELESELAAAQRAPRTGDT